MIIKVAIQCHIKLGEVKLIHDLIAIKFCQYVCRIKGALGVPTVIEAPSLILSAEGRLIGR